MPQPPKPTKSSDDHRSACEEPTVWGLLFAHGMGDLILDRFDQIGQDRAITGLDQRVDRHARHQDVATYLLPLSLQKPEPHGEEAQSGSLIEARFRRNRRRRRFDIR